MPILLFLSAMFQFQRSDSDRESNLTIVWKVVSAYRWRVPGAALFLIVDKVATVAVPLVLKHVVDALSPRKKWLLMQNGVYAQMGRLQQQEERMERAG